MHSDVFELQELEHDQFPVWYGPKFFAIGEELAYGDDIWIMVPGIPDVGQWASVVSAPEDSKDQMYLVRWWGDHETSQVVRGCIRFVRYKQCECGRRMTVGERLCHPDA